MSLQEKLDAASAAFKASAPPEAVEAIHRAVAELKESDIADRVVGVGDTAPGFELPNTGGETVRSSELLDRGPLVVTFYRGVW